MWKMARNAVVISRGDEGRIPPKLTAHRLGWGAILEKAFHGSTLLRFDACVFTPRVDFAVVRCRRVYTMGRLCRGSMPACLRHGSTLLGFDAGALTPRVDFAVV